MLSMKIHKISYRLIESQWGGGKQDRPFPGTETASTKKNHLNALMRTEIEVELGGMRDSDIQFQLTQLSTKLVLTILIEALLSQMMMLDASLR